MMVTVRDHRSRHARVAGVVDGRHGRGRLLRVLRGVDKGTTWAGTAHVQIIVLREVTNVLLNVDGFL